MKEAIDKEVHKKYKEITQSMQEKLESFFRSEGPGGQQIVAAFMDEFEKLTERSPADDPTNLRNYMDVIRAHVTRTLDESLEVDSAGNVRLGIGKDDFLGFKEERSKLKHKPQPTAWLVYLIRGIAGPYAFVNGEMYREKFGYAMPAQYAGGFLIRRDAWNREGWAEIFGPFESFKHPASGAPPIPIFRNVINKIDMNGLMQEFFKDLKYEINT